MAAAVVALGGLLGVTPEHLARSGTYADGRG